MSKSTSYSAGREQTSTYTPSDKSKSFIEIKGTTLRISQKNSIFNPKEWGAQGEIMFDNKFIYVCVKENLWKRALLSSWRNKRVCYI
jgi:hypothetical protein